MSIVVLGNVAPTIFEKADEHGTDGTQRPVTIDNGYEHDQTETAFSVPSGTPVQETIATVTHVWSRNHSTEPPAWVESDDADLATVLSAVFGCPVGRPDDWEGYDTPTVAPAVAPAEEEPTP